MKKLSPKLYLAKFQKLQPKQKAILISGFTLLVLIAIPIATFAYFAKDISSKESIMNRRNTGVTLLDRNGKEFFHLYEARHKAAVHISQIPKTVQHAAVATEDQDYYKHSGYSWKSIFGALYADIRQTELKYGGSTITQQLVKISLLNHKKSFLRKYQEFFLAVEIDRRYTKDEILEMYLNSVYFGEGAFGIEAAAQTYFGKPANTLTLAESAQLIGLLPAPSAYSPVSGNAEAAKKRQALVLERMEEQRYIKKDQRLTAQNTNLAYTTAKNGSTDKAHHFALMVKEELIQKYGEEKIVRSGYRVTTTLDLGWQNKAETALSRQLNTLRYNQVTNGSVIAIDPKNGEIKALVGSRDWNNKEFGQINMAITPRQPGSAFKPVVYSAAINKKSYTAASVVPDRPVTFGSNYTPKNYDLRYRGEVLARRALANSLNIPSVHIMTDVGVPLAVETAKKYGITSLNEPSKYGASLVLGTAEVKLSELTNAYAVFASGGKYRETSTIKTIHNKQKKVIHRTKTKPKEVLDPNVAYVISSILSDNQTRTEIFGNQLSLRRPAAVKTGTTENYRDALTIGYTPSVVVGVWLGNNNNTPMDNVAGSLGPAPIWRILMEQYTEGTAPEQFEAPKSIVKQLVCRGNGLKSDRQTSITYLEYFLPGTVPQGTCVAQEPKREIPKENNKDKEKEPKKPEEKEEKNEEEEQQDNEIPIEPTPPPPPPPNPARRTE